MADSERKSATENVAVVIPNWNGAKDLHKAVDSVLAQTYKNLTLIIVDNGSTDSSREIIDSYISKDSRVRALQLDDNYGYAGGFNRGFELAMDVNSEFIAIFNNDAVADKHWLAHLVNFLDDNSKYGIATCKLLHEDGKTMDSTGDIYTVWGLPYPRGRDEETSSKYDDMNDVFGASGGASLYRTSMLKEIGLMDEDFFAYYEDVDLSFRAQLAGWKIRYVPESIVYHEQGGTSKRMIGGFATYQSMKNMPLLLYKNVPEKFLFKIGNRFMLARILFFSRAVSRGHGWIAIKGDARATLLLFKKRSERKRIQKGKKVSDEYIWSIIDHDLPPNAFALRRLRAKWWKLRGKS